MSTKIFDIKDIKKIKREQDYKFLGLFDQNDDAIIKFNSNKSTVDKRLTEIEKRLLSEGLPDGYYKIKAKNTGGKDVVPDNYMVLKGKELPMLDEHEVQKNGTVTILTQPATDASRDHLLTYDNALKLEIQVAKLEMENTLLTNVNNALEDKVAELEKSETLSENPNSTLMNNGMQFLENLVEMAAPLWDKHLDLKEKTLGLRAMELKHRIGGAGKPFNPDEHRVQKQKDGTEDAYIAGKEQLDPYQQWIANNFDEAKPEIYDRLVVMYQDADSEQDFKDQLREYNEEMFVEFSQFILNYGK